MKKYRSKVQEVEGFQWFQTMGTNVAASLRRNMNQYEVHCWGDAWFAVEDGDWLVKDMFGVWTVYRPHEFPEAFEEIV